MCQKCVNRFRNKDAKVPKRFLQKCKIWSWILEQYCKHLNICLKGLQSVLKLSRRSGKFPDSPETFYIVWKVSSWSGKFPDSLETFRTVWKFFWTVWKRPGQSGKFPDSLESFRTVWNFFGQSGRFLTKLKSFWKAWKVSGQFGRFTKNLQTPEVCYNKDEITELGHQQSLPKK